MSGLLRWLQSSVFAYDALPYAGGVDPAFRKARRMARLLLMLFLAAGAVLIGLGLIDNKPTTASTDLARAHAEVTLSLDRWITDGIWWRGRQTPTPLPFTAHGLFFALFGYSVRGVLLLHSLLGALAAGLLFRITARRFGPWTGLLAMTLCLAAPLFLYATFSGWTFVWAACFLLLSIDLLDRAVLTRRIPLYLLAGLALGCAGMSRPENYAIAALVVLFVDIPIRYRAGFVLLVFLYPLAQYAHNNLYLGDAPGLRILDDPRSGMGYSTLFTEWFNSVRRHILDRNFAGFIQWLLLPAVLLCGLPRNRFLLSVLGYFSVAFFAAYAMRRISFNHEGYYYAHVILVMPFLAAALARVGIWTAGALRFARVPARQAAWGSVALVLVVCAVQGAMLRDAYADRLFFRVPEPVREVRDFLAAHLSDRDRVALDYFAEVSWMLAEIECKGGRDAWFYNTNNLNIPRPPLNAARKGLPEDAMVDTNNWVGANFRAWARETPPRYLITQTDVAWDRERSRKNAMGHYRMFSLRPALGLASLERISLDDAGEQVLAGSPVFQNVDFVVYELKHSLKKDTTP